MAHSFPTRRSSDLPRTSEIVGSEAFGRYAAEIWADLREEASRGMKDEEAHALHEGAS